MIRLLVAFDSVRHARAALRFLAESGRPVELVEIDEGSDAGFATVELEVAAADAPRVRTLLVGLHGVVLTERADEQAADAS